MLQLSMRFGEALKAMKQGAKVKLPSWSGYWAWENGTIMMHCKDGEVINIFDTERPEYTLDNIASDSFIIANEGNTPILGGKARMSFSDAFKLVKRGLGMRLPHWAPDVVVRMQAPTETSKMTHPYLYVESRYGAVPWKETMVELFSEEWEIVE